jgi:hypothetical protein
MTAARCSWCSAELPSPAPETCPSCGASLVAAAAQDVPGVTQVDLEALRRGQPTTQRSRSLLGFISGEYQVEEPDAPEGVLAPPPDDVRREMLRMEIAAAEAEVAAQQAEAMLEAAEAAEAAEATAAAADGETATIEDVDPGTAEGDDRAS